MEKKRVYTFGNGQAEGKADMRNLLGGKGANLAEMNLIGVPVPPGFTITTEVCNEYFEKGKDGYWYFYFDGVYANQMSDEVFITAYKGDEQVSYTLKYSVESYAATVTDAKLKAVTDAMMRYGNSAKAYAGK